MFPSSSPFARLLLAMLALCCAQHAIAGQDLAYIKTSNTPHQHVEVHIASRVSNYETRILEIETLFISETDGVFQLLENLDLVFIKTCNTQHGHVEVHCASRRSNYQSKILEYSTTFVNENNGVWQLMSNLDLAYIKTSNTPSGKVEVHCASRSSNYQTRILEVATTFESEHDGTWQLMANLDLVFIKTANTPNGHVEVHIASRISNYQSRILEVVSVFVNENNGAWMLLANLDLAYVKRANTPNNHVEVHCASRSSNYRTKTLEMATTYSNENNGRWCLV